MCVTSLSIARLQWSVWVNVNGLGVDTEQTSNAILDALPLFSSPPFDVVQALSTVIGLAKGAIAVRHITRNKADFFINLLSPQLQTL